MTAETKEKLLKFGKAIGLVFIGVVATTGVLVGAYLLKGRSGGSSSSGE
jgi:hypothetical protein